MALIDALATVGESLPLVGPLFSAGRAFTPALTSPAGAAALASANAAAAGHASDAATALTGPLTAAVDEFHQQEDRTRTFAILGIVALFMFVLLAFAGVYVVHKVL